MDLRSMIPEEYLSIVIVGGILALIFIPWIISGLLKMRRQIKVEKTGVIGSAVVTRVKQTGMYRNEDPKLAMELEVTLPGHAPYRIEKRAYVPTIYHPRVQPGMTIEVIADPDRRDDANYLGLRFKDGI